MNHKTLLRKYFFIPFSIKDMLMRKTIILIKSDYLIPYFQKQEQEIKNLISMVPCKSVISCYNFIQKN
jgi:hypothetical protein